MNQAIELSQAIWQLPLEAPEQSAWTSIQKQTTHRAVWPKWALATAASSALVFLLFFQAPSSQPDAPSVASQDSTKIEQLINQSTQMENMYYAQQDDSISSASVIAANLGIEDQLTAIDQQLAQQNNSTTTLSLWQSRIEILNAGIRLNKTNADFNSLGRNYDLALASIN